MENVITKATATEMINKSKGQIFTIVFRKKNGELRTMNCRLGVKKGVNGNGMSFEPSTMGYKPVFDMQVKDWRMINLNTLMCLKMNKRVYQVI